MWERFRYWFINVYWYHYRVHTLVGLFILAAGFVLIKDLADKTEPDLSYVMISDDVFVDNSFTDLLAPYIHPVLEDTQGDGQITSFCDALWLASSNDAAYVAAQKLALTFLDDQYALYIIFESSLGRLMNEAGADSAFIDLAALGYETHEQANWLVDTGESGIWRELSLPEGTKVYFAVRTKPDDAKESLLATRDNALRCLDRFLDYKTEVGS